MPSDVATYSKMKKTSSCVKFDFCEVQFYKNPSILDFISFFLFGTEIFLPQGFKLIEIKRNLHFLAMREKQKCSVFLLGQEIKFYWLLKFPLSFL